VSGRHESWQVRRWAPTALSAVVAFVPTSALLSAVGAAGSGYLLHRADVAAAGAGTAAVGLAVERLQTRSLRRRVRRERWEWRDEREQLRESMNELRHDLADAHHTLTVLRSRIHALHERTAETPRPSLLELASRQRLAREAVTSEDVPTMPLRRVGSAPAVSLPHQSTVAPVTGRPVPAEPERRRPLVTLAQPRVVPGTDSWCLFDPMIGRPVRDQLAVAHLTTSAARAAGMPAPARPVDPPPVDPHPVDPHPVDPHPVDPHPVQVLPPAAVATARSAVPAAVPAPPGAPTPQGAAGRKNRRDAIALGPLAQPPHLPALPGGPVEPPRAGSGMPLLPPGPRDPVSGPLAILAHLAELSRQPAPAPLPAATADAMVWASMAETEADELTVALERLGDPDRGGRHADQVQLDDATHASGLVVVGASVVGDPQARTSAGRGRHSA
jgi:uncharacterized membrane-anchored protein YhcB (DUF1043 family)